MTNRISLDYKVVEKDEETGDEDWNWESCRFTNEDLKQIDSNTGKFVFINEMGDRATLSKIKEKSFHYDAF